MCSDWAGEPEAVCGDSAVRHQREGVGTTTSMVVGDEMHGSRHGEYRFILETGIQYFGRKFEDQFG